MNYYSNCSHLHFLPRFVNFFGNPFSHHQPVQLNRPPTHDRHSTRQYALRDAVTLPGRPGYLYFGRCARLPYVLEALQSLRPRPKEIHSEVEDKVGRKRKRCQMSYQVTHKVFEGRTFSRSFCWCGYTTVHEQNLVQGVISTVFSLF